MRDPDEHPQATSGRGGEPWPSTPTMWDLDPSGPAGAPVRSLFARGELVADRFRVVRFLGQGGTAQVFEADDVALGQRVALKAIRPDVAHLPGAGERLRRELLLAREVTHPNVCRVFDVWEHRRPDLAAEAESTLVVAMQLLAGETLAQRLRRRGPLDPGRALPLIRQMAAALAAAHGAGVLHLDFKSSNVVLIDQGGETRAVVTDFGLALPVRQQRGAASGDPWGTPGYMAPEQHAGGPFTPATDVYALGCVIHETTTGAVPPAPGETVEVGDGGPARGRKRLPARWRRVVARCLDELPAARYGSPEAVVRALERRPARRWAAIGAAAALAALAAAGAFWAVSGRAAPGSPDGGALAAGERLDGPDPLVSGLPADPAARAAFDRGLAAYWRQDFAAARNGLEEAGEAAPERAAVQALSALALDRWGDLEGARRAVERAAAAAGSSPAERRLIAAAAHRVRGQPAAAADAFAELHAAFPRQPAYALAGAEAELAAGRPEGARALLDGLDADPAYREHRALVLLLGARAAGDPEARLAAAGAAGERARRDGLPLIAAAALLERGRARAATGDPDAALADLDAALETYRAAGEDRGTAEAWAEIADTRSDAGDFGDDAVEGFRRALGIYRRLGDRRNESKMLQNLGYLALQNRDLDAAERYTESAYRLAGEVGSERHLASVTTNLGLVKIMRGDFEAAETLYRLALAIQRRTGDQRSVALLHNNLGNILAARGEADRAGRQFEASRVAARQADFAALVAISGYNLAVLDEKLGRLAEATRRLRALRPAVEAAAHPRVTCMVEAQQGDVAMLSGEPETAAELLGRAATLAAETGDATCLTSARTGLLRLANESGDPAGAVPPLRAALGELDEGGTIDVLYPARWQLVRAFVAAGETEEVERIVAASAAAAESANLEHATLYRLMQTAILLGRGREAEARRVLEEGLAALPAGWLVELRFEVRWLLAEAAAKGDRGARRRLLEALAGEARERGYLPMAARAERALAGLDASGVSSEPAGRRRAPPGGGRRPTAIQ